MTENEPKPTGRAWTKTLVAGLVIFAALCAIYVLYKWQLLYRVLDDSSVRSVVGTESIDPVAAGFWDSWCQGQLDVRDDDWAEQLIPVMSFQPNSWRIEGKLAFYSDDNVDIMIMGPVNYDALLAERTDLMLGHVKASDGLRARIGSFAETEGSGWPKFIEILQEQNQILNVFSTTIEIQEEAAARIVRESFLRSSGNARLWVGDGVTFLAVPVTRDVDVECRVDVFCANGWTVTIHVRGAASAVNDVLRQVAPISWNVLPANGLDG